VIVAAVCPTTMDAPTLLFQHSLVVTLLILSNSVACAGFLFQISCGRGSRTRLSRV
jgi:hypothetical protein